jgi:hypothetical protein
VYYRRAAFCCAFSASKGLNVNDIHKKNVSCLRWQVFVAQSVSQLVEKFSERHSKIADDARPGEEVVETTAKTSMLRVSTH